MIPQKPCSLSPCSQMWKLRLRVGRVTQGHLSISGRGGARSQVSRTQCKIFSDSARAYPTGRKRKPEGLPPAPRPPPPPQDHPVLCLGTMLPIQLTPPSHHSRAHIVLCIQGHRQGMSLSHSRALYCHTLCGTCSLENRHTNTKHSPSLGQISGNLPCQVRIRGAVIAQWGLGYHPQQESPPH